MSSKTGTEDEKPGGDLRALDEGRVHEFAQQQHVETFKKLAEAERLIVRQRAELDEWERLHPVPSEMHRDAFAREMVEIYAPGLFAELDSAKAMALLARAALRIELGEIDMLLRRHGLDEKDGETLVDRIRFAIAVNANARKSPTGSSVHLDSGAGL